MAAKRKRKGRKAAVEAEGWQWDASTPEQRAARSWRMTDRGDVDPQTGKTVNPNNVQGVTFLTPVEKLVAQGMLEDRHLDAAWEYERLRRVVWGSPAQRSCIDMSPIGHDEAEPPLRDQERHDDIMRALGVFERAEMDRTVWRGEPSARPSLLASALTKIADLCGY